jgi:hypothetical protein
MGFEDWREQAFSIGSSPGYRDGRLALAAIGGH